MWNNWDSQRLLKSFHFGNQPGSVLKSSTYTYNMTYDLAIALLGIYPQRTENHYSNEYLYMNVHGITIQNYKMEERTQMSTTGPVDKQTWSHCTRERTLP